MSATRSHRSDRPSSSSTERVSKIFNTESGGDIVFRSSDNVLFYVHQKNLEFMSEGFPLANHTIPPEKPVELSEDSITLEFLFQFTRDRMPPDLDGLSFEGLVMLAEAAEKYGIYYARGACVQELRRYNQTKGFEIFTFACHHNYEKLIFELAPLLAHRPLSDFAHNIPASIYIPWSLYHDQFQKPLPTRVANVHCYSQAPSCINVNHRNFWSSKITDWTRRVMEESLPCCGISAMLDSTSVGMSEAYKGPCCAGYLAWIARLKELSRNSPEHRPLQAFVKEYKERQMTDLISNFVL